MENIFVSSVVLKTPSIKVQFYSRKITIFYSTKRNQKKENNNVTMSCSSSSHSFRFLWSIEGGFLRSILSFSNFIQKKLNKDWVIVDILNYNVTESSDGR